MAGVGDEALEIDAGVAEAGARRALHAVERGGQRGGVGAELHADAAAAGGALQHDRDSRCVSAAASASLDASRAGRVPGSSGTPLASAQFARRVLQPEGFDVARAWAR